MKKAGFGCMIVVWTLLFFLVVTPIGIVLMAFGVPWVSMAWVFNIMFIVEVFLIVGSVFL
ncbi:hypothetical protein ISR94_03950 [Candidatus Microgenomates bacterium]|nr:hypothetical protein [Candidatus Microgenomates bacterium]